MRLRTAYFSIMYKAFSGSNLGGLKASMGAAGAAVFVMSTDLEEIMQVSDRVIVLADGNLRHDAYLSETSREEILERLSEVE